MFASQPQGSLGGGDGNVMEAESGSVSLWTTTPLLDLVPDPDPDLDLDLDSLWSSVPR